MIDTETFMINRFNKLLYINLYYQLHREKQQMTDLKSKFRYNMINIISFKYVERKIDAQINPCYKLLTHCEKSFKKWKVCYYIQNEKDIKVTKLMKRINRINATCTHGKMCQLCVYYYSQRKDI